MTEILKDGLPVPGYRPQSSWALATVSGFKVDEERLLRKLDALAKLNHMGEGSVNQRWLAIARTGLETAFMALNRSIFQPTRVAEIPPEPDVDDLKAGLREARNQFRKYADEHSRKGWSAATQELRDVANAKAKVNTDLANKLSDLLV